MAKKLLLVCALLALISTSLFAQYDMKAPLPMDPNVRIGKLANGLFIDDNTRQKICFAEDHAAAGDISSSFSVFPGSADSLFDEIFIDHSIFFAG